MNWDELTETTVGTKYREFEYKCDCISLSKSNTDNTLRKTTVKDGVCIHCRHYAIKSPVHNLTAEIYKLHLEGFGYDRITQVLGLTKGTARYHVNKQKGVKKWQTQKARQLVKSKVTLKETSKP